MFMWTFRMTCNNCSQETSLGADKKNYGDISHSMCDYGNYPGPCHGDRALIMKVEEEPS